MDQSRAVAGTDRQRSAVLSCRVSHLPLLLVVQGQAEGIPEGHQGTLHGVGFGLLESRFMGLTQVSIDAVAGTAALTDQWSPARNRHRDPHPGDVGHPPARAVVPADGALGLVHAANLDGFPLPAIEPENPIGFCDHQPTLQVADLGAALLALAHLGAIEGGGEAGDLFGGEGARHGIEGVSGIWDRNQWAEV